RLRPGTRRVDAVEAAVVEAGAEDDPSVTEPSAAAVLVHPRADVEVRWHHFDGPALARLVDERGPSLFLGAALGPVDAVLPDVDVAELDTPLGGDEIRGDRRDPGAVRRCGRHGVQRIELRCEGREPCASSLSGWHALSSRD